MDPENWSGRVRFLELMLAHPVFATGIPAGYIFWADVSTEAAPVVKCE
jgi:hypothetical protein